MLDRLRQIAFLVNDLEEAQRLYRSYLGMSSCFSEDLGQYGLENAVLPAGRGTFVELLQPTTPDSAAGRYLTKRGPAPYLLIFETSNYDALIAHLRSLGVHFSEEGPNGHGRHAFVHPSSANGAFLEIIEEAAGAASGSNPWPAAGPDWREVEHLPLTRQLRQAAVLVRDLDQAIGQWGRMFGLEATKRFRVSFTGLEIAVLPLKANDTFIELAQPIGADAPSARFLERFGEGIYLTIYEIDDSLALDAHLREQGARFTTSRQTSNYTNLGFNSIWLHPSGMLGAFTQLSQVLAPDNPWPPAGDTWHLPP